MKNIKILAFALVAVISAVILAAFIREPAKKAAKTDTSDNGFALVELFTSEGCSSCPAADAAVEKIAKENAGKQVYILAYHVDYWNRLGWKDVFSDAAYSRRQRKYADWLKLSSVYTPQVIVNGKTEFVGSQENTLRNAIRAGLQKAPGAGLSLSEIKQANKRVSLAYNASGQAKGNTLLLALVQKHAKTVVRNGENGGRTLSHVQIVNKLQSIPLTAGNTGTTSLALPDNFSGNEWELIAFLQDPRNGRILAATRSALPPILTAYN